MGKNSKRFLAGVTSATLVASSFTGIVMAQGGQAFPDVDPKSEFAPAIYSLAERGIINGFPDGTFKPNEVVTRGQAAKILAGVLRLDTKNVVDPGFSDISPNHAYYGAVAALKQAGIIDGYPDGMFKSDGVIERQHMAKMIAGALKLQPRNPNALPFTDVHPMYKDAIAALYELQITKGTSATTFGGASPVLRGQLAAFVVRAEQAIAGMMPKPEPQPVPPVSQEPTAITTASFDYTNDTITIDGKAYKLAANERKIFSAANEEALHNAEIEVTVKGDTLVSVDAITFNQPGTVDQYVVFDAAVEIANIHVAADNIELKNVTVTNDLTVAGTVSEDLKLNAVEIKGNLKVEEAKPVAVASLNRMMPVANTTPAVNIIIVSSSVGTVIISQSGTSITADLAIDAIFLTAAVAAITLNATIGEFVVETDGPVEVSGEADIDEARIETPVDVDFLIAGAIAALIILNGGSTVGIAETLTIATLTIPEGTTPNEVVRDYDEAASRISVVVIPNTPAPTPPAPSPGTGGSTGGGTGGGSTPGGGGSTVDPAIATKKAELQALIDGVAKDARLYTVESLAAYNASLVSPIQEASAVIAGNPTVGQLDTAIVTFKSALEVAEDLLEESSFGIYLNRLLDLMDEAKNEVLGDHYTATSIVNYRAQLATFEEDMLAFIEIETEADRLENYINELNRKIEAAKAQYLIDINRPTSFTYDAEGETVSSLPTGVTFTEPDTFTLDENFALNRFDFYIGEGMYTASYENSEWSVASKTPILLYITALLPYEYEATGDVTQLTIGGNEGILSITLTDGLEGELFVFNMEETDLPDIIEFTQHGVNYYLERVQGQYLLKDKEYDNFEILYLDDSEMTDWIEKVTPLIKYNNNAIFISPDYTDASFNIHTILNGAEEIRTVRKVDGEWTYDYAYVDALNLSQGTANLTFTEAIEGEVLLDSVDTYAVAVTGADNELSVTFDSPLKLSELAAATTMTLTVDSYKFMYDLVNGEWVLDSFENRFSIPMMLEKAMNDQDAAYSEAFSFSMNKVDPDSEPTIAVLTYESTSQDTATVIADVTSYLGALRSANDMFTVHNITYAGVEYTWNEAATSLSEGWVDSSGNTLASKIAADYDTTENVQTFDFTTKNLFGEVYEFSVKTVLGGL